MINVKDLTEDEKEAFRNKLPSMTALDIMLFLNDDLAKAFEGHLETRKILFAGKLSNRVGKIDKQDFIKTEADKVRTNIEKDTVLNTYNLFTQPKDIFLNHGMNVLQNLSTMPSLIPTGMEYMASAEFSGTLNKLTNFDADISQEDIQTILQEIPKLGIDSSVINDVLKSDDPMRSISTVFIFIHYENLYLQFLLTKYDQIENGIAPLSINTQTSNEKIEWLGTQKQLAELFVELEKKGWIKEKNTDLIEAYFTNSNTIKQVLKPTQDAKTKEKLYEGIYSPKYKAVFDQIKPNNQS